MGEGCPIPRIVGSFPGDVCPMDATATWLIITATVSQPPQELPPSLLLAYSSPAKAHSRPCNPQPAAETKTGNVSSERLDVKVAHINAPKEDWRPNQS